MINVKLGKYENSKDALVRLANTPSNLTEDIDFDVCYFVGGVPVQDADLFVEMAKKHDIEGMIANTKVSSFPMIYGIMAKLNHCESRYRLFVIYASEGLYGDSCIYYNDIEDVNVEEIIVVVPQEFLDWEKEYYRKTIKTKRGRFEKIFIFIATVIIVLLIIVIIIS